MQIAEALRLLRTREGLTQTAASKRPGAPDFRTLSHWETRRKMPSLKLLHGYLMSLDLDFYDLQDALYEVQAPPPTGLRGEIEKLDQRVGELERQLRLAPPAERPGDEEPAGLSMRSEARNHRL